MRMFLAFLVFAAACGGTQTGAVRPRTGSGGACDVQPEEGDSTFVSDRGNSIGVSLPPPAGWSVDCDDDGDRLMKAEITATESSVTVTRDTNPQQSDEQSYMRAFMREVRQGYIQQGDEVSLPEVETYRGSPIGVFEFQRTVDGAPKAWVVAISLMATEDGHVLRCVVILPIENRFGHPRHDPAARRAMATAYSFGAL